MQVPSAMTIIPPEPRDEPAAERRPGSSDAAVHLRVGQAKVSFGQGLAFRDVFLLVRRDDGEQPALPRHCASTSRRNVAPRSS